MKYNEKVERFAPKLGRKNLANGLSCPPFVYMDYSDDGMWVHYGKYCENIAKQKYKRCLAMAKWCKSMMVFNDRYGTMTKWLHYNRWHKRWLELAEQFKDKEAK